MEFPGQRTRDSTESIRHFAEEGKGNVVIFLDGSSDNMKRTMQELMAVGKGFGVSAGGQERKTVPNS